MPSVTCATLGNIRAIKDNEYQADLINKLPNGLKFINITGGEPFLRSDIDQILENSLEKTERLVISTNGYFTDRIIKSC